MTTTFKKGHDNLVLCYLQTGEVWFTSPALRKQPSAWQAGRARACEVRTTFPNTRPTEITRRLDEMLPSHFEFRLFQRLLRAQEQFSASETLLLVKPYSLFKSLLYSLTSITAALFGEIVIRASSRSSKKYRTALLVYLLLQITMLAWMTSFSHSVGILDRAAE